MLNLEGALYRATVHYDGSGYAGFQVQPAARTVQGALEEGLRRLGIDGRIAAAGRTDAGVHATGQEISFASPRSWEEQELTRALDSVLPEDIWIEHARAAERGFHPRFRATARRYEYYLVVGRDSRSPHRRRGAWGLSRSPDAESLQRAARRILGEGDFSALSKSGQPEAGTRCTIERAQWTPTPRGDLRFTIVADRFLHRMVRYLVATMVEIGSGRRDAGDLRALLEADPGVRPAVPAPACGLYLTGVRYPDGWNREPGVPGLWP